MNKYISFIIVTILFTMPLFAKPAKPESIKYMMEKTGAKKMGLLMMNQMLPNLKKLAPNAPESFWKDIKSEINMDELVDLIIPIYQKYLNQEDIEAINKFYDTKAGQKLIKVNPKIMQESMIAGREWGSKIAQNVISKIKEKNKTKKQ